MEWPWPFGAIEEVDHRFSLEAELRRELKPGHPLFGLPARAIARRSDQDDVLFKLLDGTGRVAEVHLTWARNEKPPWPRVELFASLAEWIERGRDEFGNVRE